MSRWHMSDEERRGYEAREADHHARYPYEESHEFQQGFEERANEERRERSRQEEREEEEARELRRQEEREEEEARELRRQEEQLERHEQEQSEDDRLFEQLQDAYEQQPVKEAQ